MRNLRNTGKLRGNKEKLHKVWGREEIWAKLGELIRRKWGSVREG